MGENGITAQRASKTPACAPQAIPSTSRPRDVTRVVLARIQGNCKVGPFLSIRIRSGQAETFTARVTQAVARPPLHIEQALQVIDALSKHIETLETHLTEQAKADPVCRRLMTVPGVGPAIAIRFTAALADIARFESAQSRGDLA
jgi:transposase